MTFMLDLICRACRAGRHDRCDGGDCACTCMDGERAVTLTGR